MHHAVIVPLSSSRSPSASVDGSGAVPTRPDEGIYADQVEMIRRAQALFERSGPAEPLVHLRRFFVTDAFATALGVLVGLILTIVYGPGEWWTWTVVAVIAVMGLVRLGGMAPLARGDVRRAIAAVAAGSWGVSVGLVLLIPSVLPILIITIAIPAVLAAMFLERRDVEIVVAALALITLLCGSIGMWTVGVDLEAQVGEGVRNIVVVGYLAGQMLTLVNVVWQTSSIQRSRLDAAARLNVELQESEQRLVDSRSRLVRAADLERVRIERDLHDGAQQSLVSILLQLRIAARRADRGGPVDAAQLDGFAVDLERGIDQLRTLAQGIHPPLLEARGVFDAIRSLAQSTPVSVEVAGDDPGRLLAEIETAIYFATSEAIQNAAKHGGLDVCVEVSIRRVSSAAGASPVGVDVVDRFDDVIITIVDDGPGPDPARLHGSTGRGLANMADRLGAVGGAATVERIEPHGCAVTLRAPCRTRPVAAEDTVEVGS